MACEVAPERVHILHTLNLINPVTHSNIWRVAFIRTHLLHWEVMCGMILAAEIIWVVARLRGNMLQLYWVKVSWVSKKKFTKTGLHVWTELYEVVTKLPCHHCHDCRTLWQKFGLQQFSISMRACWVVHLNNVCSLCPEYWIISAKTCMLNGMYAIHYAYKTCMSNSYQHACWELQVLNVIFPNMYMYITCMPRYYIHVLKHFPTCM